MRLQRVVLGTRIERHGRKYVPDARRDQNQYQVVREPAQQESEHQPLSRIRREPSVTPIRAHRTHTATASVTPAAPSSGRKRDRRPVRYGYRTTTDRDRGDQPSIDVTADEWLTTLSGSPNYGKSG